MRLGHWMARLHSPSLFPFTFFLPGLTPTSQKIKKRPGPLQTALLWTSEQSWLLGELTGTSVPVKIRVAPDAYGGGRRLRPESQVVPVHTLALPSSGCVAVGGVLSLSVP